MFSISRGILLLAAIGMALGGLVALGSREPGGGIGGAWLLVGAAVIAVAVAFERTRYRPEDEATGPGRARAAAPAAGRTDRDPSEARFRPTGEVFVDPTSGRRVRVHADGTTGERRYREES